MRPELPPVCRDLLDLQGGVISRRQAISGGMDPDVVARLVRAGRWQRLRRGSYAVFTGPPPREAQLWAALHSAGPGAVLSHQTAAELFRLTDQPSSLIHVTVPAARHIDCGTGVIVHRSTRLDEARHPSLLPPRTRIEETVLDLVQQAAAFDTAFDWTCRACQRRLTTAGRLSAAMDRRKKARWRAELAAALVDIGDGVHSLLEYRYVRDVERAHGLPRARRQAQVTRQNGRGYLDNLYEEYRLCVELDGRAAHPDDRRWRDIHRDNAAAAEGRMTLRYGWADVTQRACATGWQVGTVLQQRGWPGPILPCPHCTSAKTPGD
jgi:very-short-patch-repair endonuclease